MAVIKTVVVAQLLMAVAVCSGCRSTSRVSDASIVRIDLAELRTLRANPKEHVVLIDVRSEDQYSAGHIPGSINIPLPALVEDDPRLLGSTAIVVYASTWRDNLSAAAAKRLLSMGYERVYDFRAGWEQWQSVEDS